MLIMHNYIGFFACFHAISLVIMYACTPLIDGLGHAVRDLAHASYLSQTSCVIVSGFRAALDLDTYPLSNLIRPRCAERAKPGRGEPVQLAF